MGKRTAFWSLGIATVAALGSVAAYSAADRTFLPGPGATAPSTAPAAEPVRRTSRIDGDMKATFERLEKSSAEARATPAPSQPAAARPQSAGQAEKSQVEKATSDPNFNEAPVAFPSPAPSAPVALSRPAKGMPVSLLPAAREAAAGAPRVMDPRLTRTLDQLGTGPRATVAALPEAPAASSDAAPAALRPPAGVAAVVDKNESDMTADDLNAREHRRIRQALEGAAGGTN